MNEISIILVEPQQPDNVAAIARVMASFNFNYLILVNPLLNVNDIRPEISRGGTKIIDNMKVIQTLEIVRKEHDLLIGTTAKKSITNSYTKDHINIDEMKNTLTNYNGKIGIIFGREDRGLSNEELSFCDVSLRIETSKEQSALNLSHAAAIILNNISQVEQNESKIKSISSETKERIISEIKEIYESSSIKNNTYIEKRKQTHAIVWRRLLTNPLLDEMHATAILGLLNEIRKALEEE
jgi:tRNA/rRNA methyltransferase